MKHVRYLTKVRLHSQGRTVTLIFTRAFLADHYKGLRSVTVKRKQSNPNTFVKDEPIKPPDTKFTPELDQQERSKNTKKTASESMNSVYRSRKYLSSVSHTLQTLQAKDTSSSCSSTSESSSESDAEPYYKPQPITNDRYRKEQAPEKPLKVNENENKDFDLEAALRQLGLPTQFGPLPKASPARHIYEKSDEDWSTESDEQLLLFAADCNPFLAPLSRRRRSKSHEYIHDEVGHTLTRCSSSSDLIGYHKAVFSNLCYLLELPCCYQQTRSFAPQNLEIDLAYAWNSSDFNLDAFLYSCQQYWRHNVPIPLEPTEGRTRVNVLSDLKSDPLLAKYWDQRYRLFSRFDEGVQLDRDGFFSATPEVIAAHQARRIYRALVNNAPVHQLTIIDACSGTGVNSIQLALLGFHVIAVEIDPTRIAMSAHNAKLYGVESRIDFVCADFFSWASDQLKEIRKTKTRPYAALFISPPWGGPAYLEQLVFDLNSMHFGSEPSYTFWFAIELASQLTFGNLLLYLPRNTNMTQMHAIDASIRRSAQLWSTNTCFDDNGELEVELSVLNSKVKALTVYSGDLCLFGGARRRLKNDFNKSPISSTSDILSEDEVEESDQFYSDSDSSSFSSSCSYLSASEMV